MISASRCQATMLCHSVRSCHSPALSLNRSLVAMLNLATGVPLGVYLTSGSLPRFPTRITLLTLFIVLRSFTFISQRLKAQLVISAPAECHGNQCYCTTSRGILGYWPPISSSTSVLH